MKVAVVKYNAGNIYSVIHALQRMGVDPVLTDDASELRQADPTANPYLTFAITLAAGIRGIEEGLRLPEEVSTVSMTDAEARALGIERLPRSLGRAIERFESSSFVREALGDHVCDYLLDVKRREWHDYRSTVTDWERERYYAGI